MDQYVFELVAGLASLLGNLEHSHKEKHSLETSSRLLFMLLKYFFASARLLRVHQTKFC